MKNTFSRGFSDFRCPRQRFCYAKPAPILRRKEAFACAKAMIIIMKRKQGFIVREVAGKNVAVAVGAASKEFHGMLTLNETGLFIWKQLDTDTTEEAIVSELIKVYEVDEERAKSDVHRVIEVLKNAGIVTE